MLNFRLFLLTCATAGALLPATLHAQDATSPQGAPPALEERKAERQELREQAASLRSQHEELKKEHDALKSECMGGASGGAGGTSASCKQRAEELKAKREELHSQMEALRAKANAEGFKRPEHAGHRMPKGETGDAAPSGTSNAPLSTGLGQ